MTSQPFNRSSKPAQPPRQSGAAWLAANDPEHDKARRRAKRARAKANRQAARNPGLVARYKAAVTRPS